MTEQTEIRVLKSSRNGELWLNRNDLQKFIAEAARQCESVEGRETLVNLNISLLTMKDLTSPKVSG